ARSGNPVARRAHRQSRSRRHAQRRGDRADGGPVRHQDRDGLARSRPTAPARRRRHLPGPRRAVRAGACGRFSRPPEDAGSRRLRPRRSRDLIIRTGAAMPNRFLSFAVALCVGAVAAYSPATAEDRSIIVASTTSTQDSGLFGYLLPIFKARTGIEVRVIAQGTGQALDTARRGDADVVFVHAKSQEEKFLAEGFGVKRFDVMYNDFVLIGPRGDPAGVKGKDIETALKTIQAKAGPFVSRGDRSGTHAAELALWKQAGIDIAAAKGPWYREIGQGMGAALNTASAMNGYVLSDRGTWLSFRNRGELDIVVQGDKR